MDADNVTTEELLTALASPGSAMIEDYPEDVRGRSHLILGRLADGRPIHVCCAIHEETLVIITAYRPDDSHWAGNSRERL